MKRFLPFMSLFLPLLAFSQTFGNELDTILDVYFADDAPIQVFEHDNENLNDDILTDAEWELKTKKLEFILDKADDATRNLQQLRANNEAYVAQLQTLDAEISVRSDALARLQAQKAEWEKERDARQADEDVLEAIMTKYEAELVDLLRGEFMREERLSQSPDWMAIRWVLGSETASVLQEKSYTDQQLAAARAVAMNQTQNAKKEIEKEKIMADIFVRRLEKIEKGIQNEETALYNLAKQKAEALTNNEVKKRALENEEKVLVGQVLDIQTDINQQIENEEEIRAQNLAPVSELSIEEEIEIYGFFGSPLSGDLVVSADFLEEDLQNETGVLHTGVDLVAEQGSLVYAIADGVIRKVAIDEDGYSFIEIEHEDGWRSVYGHVSASLVYSGQVVAQGEKIAESGGAIGTIGAGAFSSGPHLHLEIKKDGKFVDPERVLGV